VREGLEAWLKTRASYLEYGIRQLLNDAAGTGIAKDLFQHPLVFGLYADDYKGESTAAVKGTHKRRLSARDKNLPSYVPSRSFALALMDLAARGPYAADARAIAPSDGVTVASLRENVAKLNNPFVERVVNAAIDSAQGDLSRVEANLAAWYDSSMDRISGWYKRTTHKMLLLISIVICAGMNINTLSIADYLFRHSTVRSTIIAGIEKNAGSDEVQKLSYDEARTRLDNLRLPMGWSGTLAESWGAPRTRAERAMDARIALDEVRFNLWSDLFAPLLGWSITAFAATLGAPFWFDVLNKIMVIRSTVKPREKSQEEGSEDRTMTPGQAATTHSPAATSASTPTSTSASATLPPAQAADDHDVCGVGAHIAATPDDRLPAADGGVA
jgi:hypothetical protein